MDAKEFGQYLRSVRKAAEITLEALGEQVDLSKSHLSNIERGERGIPSPAILQKLAKPLGVMYSDLMVKAGYYSEATQEDIDDFFARPDTAPITLIEKARHEITGLPLTRDEIIERIHDIGHLLKYRENAYYNGHQLTDQDRQRILDMLKVLFPDYSKEG